MTPQPLNNAIREAIAKAAMVNFNTRAEALKLEEAVLAREAYESVHTVQELDAIQNVPTNWFRNDACLSFNVAGLSLTLRTYDAGLPVPYRPRGEEGSYHCNRLGAIKAGDLADRIMKLEDDCKSNNVAREAAYSSVMALLKGISSLKKLVEVWPEGKPFYERFLFEKVINTLPAISMEKLNASLGLAP